LATIASMPLISTSASDGTSSHLAIAAIPCRAAAYASSSCGDGAHAISTRLAANAPSTPTLPISCSTLSVFLRMSRVRPAMNRLYHSNS